MLFLAVVLVRKHSYRRFLTLVQSLTEHTKKKVRFNTTSRLDQNDKRGAFLRMRKRTLTFLETSRSTWYYRTPRKVSLQLPTRP